MVDKNVILVGSRKSELALIQTRHVISELKHKFPDKEFKIITMSTLGDQILDKPLPKIGEKSLFTKELEVALATGCVDFVVHSLKDLPTCLPEGMAIGAILEREDPRDALVLREDLKGHSLQTLSTGSVIGTSSLRRTAQIARKYPHLVVENIRGNLNTRLRKLDESNKYSAIILAQAGLRRMMWDHRISEVLDASDLLYAVGQGALAVECRDDDFATIKMLKVLQDSETILRVLAERSFLKTLGGGCSAPVAVTSTLTKTDEKFSLELTGAVWSLDGSKMLSDKKDCSIDFNVLSELHKNCKGNECYGLQKESSNRNLDIIDQPPNSHKRKCPVQFKNISINDVVISDGNKTGSVQNNSDCEVKKIKLDLKGDGSFNIESVKVCPFLNGQCSGDKCPVNLPVGVDFMGKCPYLDTQHEMGKCPVNAEIFTDGATTSSSSIPLKCPFLNHEINFPNDTESIKLAPDIKRIKSYCGIIGYKTVSEQALENMEKIGIDLANSLISKGALTVMQEARSHICSTGTEK